MIKCNIKSGNEIDVEKKTIDNKSTCLDMANELLRNFIECKWQYLTYYLPIMYNKSDNKEEFYMGVTMQEIAYMCGVSRGTVDRVLNNRGKVKPETEERIRTTAESMGYRFHTSSQSLSVGRRQLKIGVLVNAAGHEYYSNILSGILSALEELYIYDIIGISKISSGLDADQQLPQLDELMAQGISALAITPANDERIVEKLTQITNDGIPVVVVSTPIKDFQPFSYVGSDHYCSGRIAGGFARQIVPQGSEVSIMIGSLKMVGHERRIEGFMDALQAKGGNYHLLTPVQSFDDDVISYKVISNMVSRHPNIRLIFFAAGGYSGGYQALDDAGLLGKIKVIAYDAVEPNIVQLKKGNVSAVFDQHPTKQGRHAIKQLSEYLLNHRIPEKRINYEPTEILLDESFYVPVSEAEQK